jgi:hypothetical protein
VFPIRRKRTMFRPLLVGGTKLPPAAYADQHGSATGRFERTDARVGRTPAASLMPRPYLLRNHPMSPCNGWPSARTTPRAWQAPADSHRILIRSAGLPTSSGTGAQVVTDSVRVHMGSSALCDTCLGERVLPGRHHREPRSRIRAGLKFYSALGRAPIPHSTYVAARRSSHCPARRRHRHSAVHKRRSPGTGHFRESPFGTRSATPSHMRAPPVKRLPDIDRNTRPKRPHMAS